MRTLTILVVPCAALLAGCAMMPPPVPMSGAAAEIHALAGVWNGSYVGGTGRQGSIRFELAADADIAFGDVLMLPSRQPRRDATPDQATYGAAQSPRALSIAFVRAAGDSVHGVLDPYEDPECGCTLWTRFDGRLHGDAITGTYVTRGWRTGEVLTGTWNVRRDR
ncbi:MAG TPA: hypothetical protein VKA21_05320 [Candidatus Binatia bacterium]|nr:hypothetical protein [Candidatus Binatia bacterium]